jgi:hypothetical protein
MKDSLKAAVRRVATLHGAHDPSDVFTIGGDFFAGVAVGGVHTAMVRLRQSKPHLFGSAKQMTPEQRDEALREFRREPDREAEAACLARTYARLGIKNNN